MAAIFLTVFSCTKKKADTATAGKGGNASITLYPQHHGVAKNLRDMKLYIKYNAVSPPSNGVYDDSVSCTRSDTFSVGTFTGLKDGPYYLFGYGYDTSIFENVRGGFPDTILQQSSQTRDIAVSED